MNIGHYKVNCSRFDRKQENFVDSRVFIACKIGENEESEDDNTIVDET